MNQAAEALKERTTALALRVLSFCRSLDRDWESRHLRDQLFRSSTSLAANYHACCRARSRRDFVSKLGIVVEEADETVFWLLFIRRANVAGAPALDSLITETRELLAIFTASARTAHANIRADTAARRA